MKKTSPIFNSLVLACSALTSSILGYAGLGCAGRTTPFDQMDKASITIMKLTTPPAPVAPALPGIPGLPPIAIPGVTPEMMAQGQQLLQGLIPGLIPGATPAQAPAPQMKRWKDWSVAAEAPLLDQDMKNELLDLFGSEDSFQQGQASCFNVGMGISMVSPDRQGPPVDLMVSFSCNQIKADGFVWPYKTNSMTGDAHGKLQKLFEKMGWGPVPAGG